ncbi:MAG: adenosylcobinamide-GDP ribazoletransferase [Candidatus Adiutrix sp.]|nr:adenosylcobinamide-GDP ribazoletransferase [Candidatus Adiutrix sp.]
MKAAEYLKSFWPCLSFMSLIPTGRDTPLTPEEMGRFPAFYPVVGLFLGLDMFILWLLIAPLLPARVAALLVVIFLVVVNRGFHLDGLSDTADALFSHQPRQRQLEIMKDSHQGTFGVLSIVLAILLKVEFVALLAPDAPWFLILWPVWGRVAASVAAVRSTYVGLSQGLGYLMVAKSTSREMFLAALFTLLLSCGGGWAALLTAVAAILCGLILTRIWRAALGGVTGDLLGATIELTEMASLILFFIFNNMSNGASA